MTPGSFCSLKNHDNNRLLGAAAVGMCSVCKKLLLHSHRVWTRNPESSLLSKPCRPGIDECVDMALTPGGKSRGVLSKTE